MHVPWAASLLAAWDFFQPTTIWPPLAVLAVAILLVFAEVLIPSHGIISLIATLCVVVSLIMAGHVGTAAFVLTMLLVLVLLPVTIIVVLRMWPHTYMGKRIFLNKPEAEEVPSHSQAANMDLERLVGSVGRTITPLRPSGATEIDGRRVDTVSEGLMVDAGALVRVLSVRGNHVVVRPLGPDELPTEPDAEADDTGESTAPPSTGNA